MARITLPTAEHPVASIILIAWKQLDLLLACLASLSEALRTSQPAEVIIVLNDVTQTMKDTLAREVVGARFVEAATNLGFSGGSNLGAHHARGTYLVFLNDDAQVAPRWLEWLIATAEVHPRAGAIGSLILFPDGRIQEAGSVIWADGSTRPIGRYDPGDAVRWQHVRQVDYVSACSLLVRRAAWDEVGGFDPEYHPAYYEDVDLSLAMRVAGWESWLEPRSRVWHHESASSDSSFKRFLFARNQHRLRTKWVGELALQEPAAPESPAALARAQWRAAGTPARILAVDDRVPDPSLGSGYGRMHAALLEWAAAGHQVSLYPVLGVDGPIPETLVSAGVRIIDGALDAHLAQPWQFYDVAVISRPHNFDRTARVIALRQPQAILIYDCEALFWRRMVRQAAITVDTVERGELEAAAAKMRRLEESIVVQAHAAVTVSEEEADLLRQVEGCCPIQPLLPAEPAVTFGPGAVHRRHGIGYVAGWMAGPTSPNADGLRWFIRDVLPLARAAVPWLRVDVTGAHPPEDLVALADPNVRFVGHVADLGTFYDQHRVIIAPIRFGAGVKVKTVQAIQYGVPVVSTTCGAEGIALGGSAAVAIEDDPERFAADIVDLLTDRDRWESAQAAARQLVEGWRQSQDSVSWRAIIAHALAGRPRVSDPLFAGR